MDRELVNILYEIGLDNSQILKLQMYPDLVDFVKNFAYMKKNSFLPMLKYLYKFHSRGRILI